MRAIVLVALFLGACNSPPRPVLVAAPPPAPEPSAPPPAPSSSHATPHGHIATPEEAAKLMTPPSGDAGTNDASPAGLMGRIPPEEIKRVIRATFPRFRKCYEAALKQTKGDAHGTVISRYVIGLDGTIEIIHSYAQDPSIPKSMIDCISVEYLNLRFPEPIGGKVMVTYPLDFQNHE